MMKTCLSICLLLLFTGAHAQKQPADKWRYYGLHQVGWLAGSSPDAAGVLTTNGLYKGNWYTGLSIGLDYCGIRSVPLMATACRMLGKARSKPYLYGSAGISMPWQRGPNLYEWQRLSKATFRSGIIGEAGLGYRVAGMGKSGALTLSLGYSYKINYLQVAYASPNEVPGNYYSNGFTNSYHYRRIAFRIGIGL